MKYEWLRVLLSPTLPLCPSVLWFFYDTWEVVEWHEHSRVSAWQDSDCVVLLFTLHSQNHGTKQKCSTLVAVGKCNRPGRFFYLWSHLCYGSACVHTGVQKGGWPLPKLFAVVPCLIRFSDWSGISGDVCELGPKQSSQSCQVCNNPVAPQTLSWLCLICL